MKESLVSDDRKFLNDLFENLIFDWTAKKLLNVLATETLIINLLFIFGD